jgi:hypothetical protein
VLVLLSCEFINLPRCSRSQLSHDWRNVIFQTTYGRISGRFLSDHRRHTSCFHATIQTLFLCVAQYQELYDTLLKICDESDIKIHHESDVTGAVKTSNGIAVSLSDNRVPHGDVVRGNGLCKTICASNLLCLQAYCSRWT